MAKNFFFLAVVAVLGFQVIAAQVQQRFVLLELKYDNGEFTLINKTLEYGYYPTINHDAQKKYQLNLISETNETLYSNQFDPSKLYSDLQEGEELQGGVIELNDTRFFVISPDISKGDRVDIIKDNKTIFSTEVYNVGAVSCRVK